MYRQTEIFEFLPKGTSKKSKRLIVAFTPTIGHCESKCGNYCTHFPDGTLDTYPGTGSPRCVNMNFNDGKVIINNLWVTTCPNYKPKEE